MTIQPPQQQPAHEPMTAERLAAIRARAEASSVGPWHVGSFGLHTGARDADGYIDPDQMRADMEFIAASRQDVPDLLAFAEAALPILRAVATCEAIAIPHGDAGDDVIALRNAETNVLWMRQQARALLAGMSEHEESGADE